MTWRVYVATHRFPYIVGDDAATLADNRYVMRASGRYARRWKHREAAQKVADKLNRAGDAPQVAAAQEDFRLHGDYHIA